MNPIESFLGKGASAPDSDKSPKPSKTSPFGDEEGSGKIQFNMPAGFKVPDGVKDGEPFDAMATMKLVGGKLVLHELDGTPVDGSEGKEEADEADEADKAEEAEESDELDAAPKPSKDKEDDGGEDSGLSFLDMIEKKAGKRKLT